MSDDVSVTVISVGALDKYHAVELAHDEMEAIDRKVGERRLYQVNNEDMVSADAVDAIAMNRFKRIGVGIDVETPPRPDLVKIDEDDKSTWFWSASARARNVHQDAEYLAEGRPRENEFIDGWQVGIGDAHYTHPEKDGKYTKRDKDGNIVYSQRINPHAFKSSIRKAVRNAKMRCLGDHEIEMGLAKTKKMLEDPEAAKKIRAARQKMGHPEGGPSAAKSESSPAPANGDPPSTGAGGGRPGPSPPPASSASTQAGGGGGGDGPKMASDKQVAYAGGLAAQISRAAGGTEAEQRSARKSAEDEVRAMTMASAVQRITDLKEEAGK